MGRSIELRVEKEVTAVENEIEVQYQVVSEEVLAELGWKHFKRTDGHVFTVLVPQAISPETAFDRGIVFVKHQMKAVNGREILPGMHINHLIKTDYKSGKLVGEQKMCTEYNPQIGHPTYIVLEKFREV